MQDPASAAQARRTFQQRLNDPVILSFGPLPNQDLLQTASLPKQTSAQHQPHGLPDEAAELGLPDEAQAGQGLVLRYSAVKAALPLNVQLITLKAMPEGAVLLRLAHLYQASTCNNDVVVQSDVARPKRTDKQPKFIAKLLFFVLHSWSCSAASYPCVMLT